MHVVYYIGIYFKFKINYVTDKQTLHTIHMNILIFQQAVERTEAGTAGTSRRYKRWKNEYNLAKQKKKNMVRKTKTFFASL